MREYSTIVLVRGIWENGVPSLSASFRWKGQKGERERERGDNWCRAATGWRLMLYYIPFLLLLYTTMCSCCTDCCATGTVFMRSWRCLLSQICYNILIKWSWIPLTFPLASDQGYSNRFFLKSMYCVCEFGQ